MFHFLTCLLLLVSCQNADISQPNSSMQYIQSRDVEGSRPAVYRMRVPNEWIRRDPLPNEPLEDTTLSICDFFIYENGEKIRIAIHNFPTNTMEERIPSQAQVARWKRQFDQLQNETSSVMAQAFSGYSGLLFTGVGKIKDQDTMVLAWSLQLAPEHYRTLSQGHDTYQQSLLKQKRADVTIKATGPKSLMEKHQEAIIASARSFELIDEIPSHL